MNWGKELESQATDELKSGDWRSKIKLHTSDAIVMRRFAGDLNASLTL
jgi:hypothetical protein